MEPSGIVSLLQLLHARLSNDPTRWASTYKNLLSTVDRPTQQEQPLPARWNGVSYGALLSTWRNKGLAHRADALDICLERLSGFAQSNFPVDAILRLLLVLADVDPSTNLTPESCYGRSESQSTESAACDLVLTRSFPEQLQLLSTPVILPELREELPPVDSLNSSFALPTQSTFFHLPETSVHTLDPLPSPSDTTRPSAATITRTDSSHFITSVRSSFESTLWEKAATSDERGKIDWQTLEGSAPSKPLWHHFPTLATAVQFEELYRTHCTDALARECVATPSEQSLTQSLVLACMGTSTPLIACNATSGCVVSSGRIRLPCASYSTSTSVCNLALASATQASSLRRWAEQSSDPKTVGSVRYAVGRLVHSLMTQFSAYALEFRSSGRPQTVLALYNYLTPSLPMLEKLSSLLQSSSASGIKLIDALYRNCNGGLFGRTEPTPLIALSYELLFVSVLPLLAFLDSLITNTDVSLELIDAAHEFHVPSPVANEIKFSFPECLAGTLSPVHRLIQVLRVMRSVSVDPPQVPLLAAALPDRPTNTTVEALLQWCIQTPLVAIVKDAEARLLSSLRTQHSLDHHLDALCLFFLSENGLFPSTLLKVTASSALSVSAERTLHTVLIDCALDAHPCARYLAVKFGAEVLAADVPLPRLVYQLPELLNIAISNDVMAKYSAAFVFLLELRWHASIVQRAIAANAKSKRSEEESKGDALGFTLVHVLNALRSYATQEIVRFRRQWTTQRAAAESLSQLDTAHTRCVDSLLEALFLAPRTAPVRNLFVEFLQQAREYAQRKSGPQALVELQRRRRLLRLVLLKLDMRSTAADVASLALALS